MKLAYLVIDQRRVPCKNRFCVEAMRRDPPGRGAQPRCEQIKLGHPAYSVSRNLRAILIVLASDLMLGGLLHTGAIAASDPSEAEYSAAIDTARAGDAVGALPVIERRYRENPTNPAAAYNYILVLGWANRQSDAIAV